MTTGQQPDAASVRAAMRMVQHHLADPTHHYCDLACECVGATVHYKDPAGRYPPIGRDWVLGGLWANETRTRRWLADTYGLDLIGADYRNATVRLRLTELQRQVAAFRKAAGPFRPYGTTK